MKILMVAVGLAAIGFALNANYERTYKSPNGIEVVERFNIQTKFDLTLDKKGQQKTAH